MTIDVQAPDGSIARFPDGMPDDQITAVMRQHFPAPAAQSPLGGAMPTAADVVKTQGDPRPSIGQEVGAVASNTADTLRAAAGAIPFSDRIEAGAKALVGGGGYSQNLADEQAARADLAARRPMLNTVGHVVGALPLAAIPGAAPAEGLGGALMAGAKVGAGYGAAQGASDSPDLTNVPATLGDMLAGAGKGGSIGMLSAGAGYGAGKGFSAIDDWLNPNENPINGNWGATNKLLQAHQRDAAVQPLDAPIDLGPKGMTVDTGPNMLGLARAIGTQPGAGQPIVTNALTERMRGIDSDIANALPGIIGPDQSALGAALEMKATKSAEAAALPSILGNAGPVDTTPILARIDQIAQHLAPGLPEAQAVAKVRNSLIDAPAQPGTPSVRTPVLGPQGQVIRYELTPGTPAVPEQPITDASVLNNAKGAISNMVERGDPTIGVQPGALASKEGSLKTITGGVNNALREQVPGYGDKMDQLASINRQIEALQYGRDKLLAGGNNAIHPDDSGAHIAALPNEEASVLQSGVNSRLYQDIGTKSNSRAALNRIMPPQADPNDPNVAKWNSEKLGQIYSPEQVDQLRTVQGRANTFARSYNAVQAGPDTATKLAAQEDLNNPDVAALASKAATPWGRARLVAEKATGYIGDKFLNRDEQNAAIARALVAQGPARDAISEAFQRLLIDKAMRPIRSSAAGAASAPIFTGLGLGLLDR
jgi:hypothetical protein